MSTGPRLELRHSQSLVLTPQLQQSLKILQYSTQELLNYIESELEQNPLLSVAEQLEVEGPGEKKDNLHDSESYKNSDDTAKSEDFSSVSDGVLDTSYENTWDEKENSNQTEQSQEQYHESSQQDFGSGKGNRSSFDDSSTSLEQNISSAKTLRDHLLEQVTADFDSAEEKIIAAHIIDALDDSGYLTKDTKPLQELLGCTTEQIEGVIRKLQKFDPPGIFARSLSECLALQLADRNRLDPAMQKLIENLELCAKGELKKLEKICGVGHEDMVDMINEIKTLNPKPGSDFSGEMVQALVPDIYVRKNPFKSEWIVELNNENLPKLLVNKKYYSEVKGKVSGEKERKYLSEKMNTANWLVKALNQRAETILKVATELVAQQNEFFEKGIKYLKPMVLRDIADAIEMHESTVGRVTTGKYIATPRGTYELKFFFSSSLGEGAAGESEVSSRTVKHRIKELIDHEDNEKILSDDKIVQILGNESMNVARRTVAKYRDALGIPSSSQRRRQKRLQSVK